MVQQVVQLGPRWPRCLAAASILISAACLTATQARAYTATFTLTGSDIGNNSVVNSRSVASDGGGSLTLTISGLNDGGLRFDSVFGLCAYYAENNSSINSCKNSGVTSYNGLNFKVTSGQTLYNVKFTSFTVGTRNASTTILSTFTGANGSSEIVGPIANLPIGSPYALTTPVTANPQNEISLCSTPQINGQSCTGNIVNGSNTFTNPSLYTIQSMTFTYDTPGPLPILGAGAAFGWSRRLRKRIHHSPVRSSAPNPG
jgi:hypothetical protein